MTPKNKRTILYSVLFIVIICAGTGYYLYNKKPLSPNEVTPDTTTTSSDLYHAFAADTAGAKKKFSLNNEVVQVTGIVSGISQNQDKQTVILLKTGEGGGAVNCTMEGPAEHIKEGDSVNLKGFCTGMGAGDADLGMVPDVYMIRCYNTNK